MTVSLPSAEDMRRQSETDERKLSGLSGRYVLTMAFI